MSTLQGIGTYLPVWVDGRRRVAGADEDALTLAVAAGRAVLHGEGVPDDYVTKVVLVTRDLPLVEGGNGAALLAGLGLARGVSVVEQVGGAPDVLDVISGAEPRTLVLAADLDPAGAGACLVGPDGASEATLSLLGRVTRSLPVTSRGRDGIRWDYDDPRLMLERGAKVALAELDLGKVPDVVAGLGAKPAGALSAGTAPLLPTTGASAAVFALAAARSGDVVLASEQASAVAAALTATPPVHRDEAALREVSRTRATPGPDIGISLPAYDRAFDAKVRWEAGRCDACGHLAMPPRLRCTRCGSEDGWSLEPLPRTGVVYSKVDIHVPVPGRATPYSLAIVELDGTDVRTLVTVTGAPAGSVDIGDRGTLVLRLVDTRSGVPDYGHALLPESVVDPEGESA
ncbi:Zn-ribbon domain-containing OB-fold protein [Arsenicicoccus sp. UBA7492]|uniref:Zn-ribbon domain-containing OB-fold protein n=1 Tax=Arsenicicoccus sp. UBA7492 TaxID=1946057 RepID=UPI00257C5A71|nr:MULTISPECIES: OB-fold domain-containing protein [Actinomycetes]